MTLKTQNTNKRNKYRKIKKGILELRGVPDYTIWGRGMDNENTKATGEVYYEKLARKGLEKTINNLISRMNRKIVGEPSESL